jgi:pSer/pThr/pTyr-binding forkhead associated (FHA) protein
MTNSEFPILTCVEGPLTGQQWPLDGDELVLGRDEQCAISVPERPISRQHIRVFRQNTSYFVQDLESKNGTWLNERKLEGIAPLSNGDVIDVAHTIKLHFGSADNATATLPFVLDTVKGRLRLDMESRRVYVLNKEIDPPLSLPQYRLLELLYTNVGRICTREDVVSAVWPDVSGDGVSEQAIDALVRRLRDRLAEIDPDIPYVVTVRGHGFRMDQN